jgi:hypothetical protein
MQTLLENIFRSCDFFKPGMWIDKIERNTHIKILAQTYFRLKDTKLAKSGTKGQKNNTISYFVLFLPCIMILSNLYLLNENIFGLEFLCACFSLSHLSTCKVSKKITNPKYIF